MTNQFTHIADVKVGKVRGNSRIYPQLRLPSQYVELACKKASIYEISGHEENPAFIIQFDSQNHVAAYHGDRQHGCVANGREVPVKPCRGSDSGLNPDSGAPFLLALAFSFLFKRSSDFCSLISDFNQ
jgi:hypothetical protein